MSKGVKIIKEFKKAFQNGFEITLNSGEKDTIIAYINYLEQLQDLDKKKIDKLTLDLEQTNSQLSGLARIHIKAIKYIDKIIKSKVNSEDTLYYIEKILLGSDKE